MNSDDVFNELKNSAKSDLAVQQKRFFKTGKGEYGEGDIFLGIYVPQVRTISKKYKDLPLIEVEKLLESAIHEVRLCALLILVESFKKANARKQKDIIDLYLSRTDRINNWDLVDLSASMFGTWLLDKDRSILYTLADSDNMWEQRLAVVSTNIFIRKNDFEDILELSVMLMSHKHDLIHKAIGWMLREVGKKDRTVLIDFLTEHSREMPRTMLRYSIEHFPKEIRMEWLKK